MSKGNLQGKLTPARAGRILADMKPLYMILKEWQDYVRLTPSEAARQCGVSPQQWFELTSGATRDPRASTLRKLASGTGMPIEFLVEASALRTPPRAEPVPALT